MTTIAETSADSLEADFVGELACGFEDHDKGTFFHIPEQSAGWRIQMPCGHKGDCCDGWVAEVRRSDMVVCSCDAGWHASEDMTAVAI